jgi:hypothetical protein
MPQRQDGESGIRIATGAKRCSILQNVQTNSGNHPASYCMGTGVLSRGVKRPRREADHSPPSGTDVKNE